MTMPNDTEMTTEQLVKRLGLQRVLSDLVEITDLPEVYLQAVRCVLKVAAEVYAARHSWEQGE